MLYISLCLFVFFSTLTCSLKTSLKTSLEDNPSNYSVGEANRMCEFELASYCCGNLGHGVADWSCQACQLQPQINNITVVSSSLSSFKDANGFVAYDPIAQSIIIAFAGTDPLSILDWIDDIDTIKVDYPACSGCEVHKGFYETYLAISDQVWDAVEKLWEQFGRKVNLQIVGHSLGAALAAFCAIDFWDAAAIEPQFVYTFGQPRIGNEDFEDYYHENIHQHFRVTHRKDPVPHVPPEDFGFEHGPQEIFYPHNPNDTYSICTGGEDPNCSDQYLTDLDINDHLDYMGEIKKKKKKLLK